MRESGRVVARTPGPRPGGRGGRRDPARAGRGGTRGAARGGGLLAVPRLQAALRAHPVPRRHLRLRERRDRRTASPPPYRLRDGDLVSVDAGALLGGWAGDSAVSFTVGRGPPRRHRADRRGHRRAGGGHRGGGRRQPDRRHRPRHRHGLPQGGLRHPRTGTAATASAVRCTRTRPCRTRDGPGAACRCATGWSSRSSPCCSPAASTSSATTPDGWTLRTTDGSRAAHAEHTVAITKDGPRVLTAL